jgi:anti-anti-sigma factor
MSESLIFEELGLHGRSEVIRVRGRLDARTSPLLMERCAAARDANRHLVLNLRDVSFLSSSGIGSLLALTEEFRERGTLVALVEASPTVREAIELLNLEEFLMLFDTEDEAIQQQAA